MSPSSPIPPSSSSPSSPETVVRVGAVELCYDTFGDRAKPALLLVMGLGTQMIAWDAAFCSALAARGYFVIRFDNRDIGRSTWLDDEEVPNLVALFAKAAIGFKPKVPYTLADMALDAIGLLDALGVANAHVVGASMGGMIGQQLAIDHRDRLLTFTSIMSTTGDAKLPVADAATRGLLMGPPAKDEDEFVAHYRHLLTVLRADAFPEDEALDEPRARAAWRRGYHPAGSARQLAAIIASGNRTKALRTVATPTLVIHGKTDPLVPVEGGIATAAAVPGAKLLLIDRMGHALPMACWSEVIDAVAAHAR